MGERFLAAVFDSVPRAQQAQWQLSQIGVRSELSIDLTADGIAAEVPGQVYQNQPGQGADDLGSAGLFELLSGRSADRQDAVARRAARIQSGGCLLTVDAADAGSASLPGLLLEQGARCLA